MPAVRVKSGGARGGRRASPTGSCGACPTTPRSRPTAPSPRRWRGTRSYGRAWTRAGSTSSIGASSRRSWTCGGGPVGLEAVAATINDEAETLSEIVEPYLLKIGFIAREPRGRRVTREAYAHLGKQPPAGQAPGQSTLF